MRKFTEQAVMLGRHKSLVGIFTQAATPPACRLPAIVILNTGIIHRVGHARMYVTLSRTLAAAGHMVLRFDFSGLGDSAPSAEGLPPPELSLADIREALDWLETACNAPRVILVGLCSAADHALLYGHTDPHVVGLILMDPSIPPTARYLVDYLRPRLTRLSSWLSVLRGQSRIWRMLVERIAYAVRSTWEPEYVSLQSPRVRAYLEQVYQRSLDRGIEFLAIFTGQSFSRQTYREQLLDAFPGVAFGKQLRLEFFRDCDHAFTFESDRKELIRVIVEWMASTEFRDAVKRT